MKGYIKLGLFVALAAVMSGCISPQSYVDPAYRKATFASVKQTQTATPVKVQIEFQRNGEHFPRAEKVLRANVEKTLTASGVLVPTKDESVATTFGVTANNIADLAAARSKGFKTGLTFGASGSMVDDNYEFQCTFVGRSGQKRNMNYKHAIHTAIGKTDERPEGLTPTKPNDAFGKVVEDVVLNCLQNLQLSDAL